MIKIVNKEELSYRTFFSSAIPDIEIESSDARSFEVMVNCERYDGNGVEGPSGITSYLLYKETVSPNADHKFVLQDLLGLLSHCMRDELLAAVRVSFNGASGYADLCFLVVYVHECVGVDADAEDFLLHRFLSVLDGSRRTCLGRKEVLHVLVKEEMIFDDEEEEVDDEEVAEEEEAPFDVAVSIRDYYSDGTWEDRVGEKRKVLFRIPGNFGDRWHCYAIDASPVAKEGKVLVRYVVTVGERTQEYIVDYEHEEANAVVMFINSFGVPEYAYVNGSVKGMSEYERQGAVINGSYRNFKIKETRYWEANTGCLSEEEEEWFLDLLRSDEVYICRSGEPWKEIAIVESKAESTSDGDALNRYTFKYRISDRHQSFVGFRSYPEIFTGEYNRIFR